MVLRLDHVMATCDRTVIASGAKQPTIGLWLNEPPASEVLDNTLIQIPPFRIHGLDQLQLVFA